MRGKEKIGERNEMDEREGEKERKPGNERK